jgi:hypothetical protein
MDNPVLGKILRVKENNWVGKGQANRRVPESLFFNRKKNNFFHEQQFFK